MSEKQGVTAENVDIARLAFGAYQSYDEKPVRVEVLVYADGASIDLVYGQVNPCVFGDQCGGHACYCNHPKGYRKCHSSWYYGGRNGSEDKDCEYYEPNPYWQGGYGGFYELREKTLDYLREQDLVFVEVEQLAMEAPLYHKNCKSKFL